MPQGVPGAYYIYHNDYRPNSPLGNLTASVTVSADYLMLRSAEAASLEALHTALTLRQHTYNHRRDD